MKPIPNPQHQVIRLMEFMQLVADMQERVAGDGEFEGYDLVKTFQAAFVVV